MKYMFFDTAVNGYYTLVVLQKAFPEFRPLIPARENIADDVSPFIFHIDDNEKLSALKNNSPVSLQKIIFIDSAETIDNVKNYYSQFVIQKIKGKDFYFRFWAADVFQKFITTCDSKQLKEFFGPVLQFSFPDEDPAFQVLFSFNGVSLLTNRVAADFANSTGREAVVSDNKIFKAEEVVQGNNSDNSGSNQNIPTQQGKRPPRRFFS